MESESPPSAQPLPAKSEPHSKSSPELGQSHAAELRLAALRLSRDRDQPGASAAEPGGPNAGSSFRVSDKAAPGGERGGGPLDPLERQGQGGAVEGFAEGSREGPWEGLSGAAAGGGAEAVGGGRLVPKPEHRRGAEPSGDEGNGGASVRDSGGEGTVLDRRKDDPVQGREETPLAMRHSAPEASPSWMSR